MNYKQLTNEMKVKIDTLLEMNLSMREVGRRLGISHSTISRYKNNVYKKRTIDIKKKHKDFLEYLDKYYDSRTKSIELCVYSFRKYYPGKPCVTAQTVYRWINEDKINIKSQTYVLYKTQKEEKKRYDESFKEQFRH